MDVVKWLSTGKTGIAHRSVALDHGGTPARIRAARRAGELRVIRRAWVALPNASGDLVTAAEAGGRVACVSAARHRGWWVPESAADELHLHLAPNARSTALATVTHWTTPVAPVSPADLIESRESTLAHVVGCLPAEQARAVWESAVHADDALSIEALRHVAWPNAAARRIAADLTGLSDSGLETLFVVRLSSWGLPIRQQVRLAGRRVDFLIGERLVVQTDGYAHHSSSAQRTRDVAHDAELHLRGYTVLRFTYAQIVHGWDQVEATLSRAIAAGLHVAG